MSKAEEKALKVYPKIGLYDNLMKREGFIEGYHQAEKDLELTWKDIKFILKISYKTSSDVAHNRGGYISEKEFYQEVLKQFKERKEL